MKIIIVFMLAATVLLTACNTLGKVQQTPATETPAPAIEHNAVLPQVVELDLTGLFPSNFSGRKVTVNNGALKLTTDSEGRCSMADFSDYSLYRQNCRSVNSSRGNGLSEVHATINTRRDEKIYSGC